MRKGIAFALLSIVTSCGLEKYERHIDFDKSEEIIEYMEDSNIQKLGRTADDNLIINDTLVVFNTFKEDSLRDSFGLTRMRIDEWLHQRAIDRKILTTLRDLMIASQNVRIVEEGDSYFFTESGWIDSESGKVYSLERSSLDRDMKSLFKFERTREIEQINERQNWYEYYAD